MVSIKRSLEQQPLERKRIDIIGFLNIYSNVWGFWTRMAVTNRLVTQRSFLESDRNGDNY
jgi:hypothetical protein